MDLLLPIDGQKLMFAQLYIYIYDTKYEISNRIRVMNSDKIDEKIVEGLIKMFV